MTEYEEIETESESQVQDDTNSRLLGVLNIGSIITSLLVFAILPFIHLFILPKFQKTFNELGVELPLVTRFIMSPFLPIGAFIVFLILAFLTLSSKKPYAAIFVPVLCIIVPIYVFGLFMPLVEVIESL